MSSRRIYSYLNQRFFSFILFVLITLAIESLLARGSYEYIAGDGTRVELRAEDQIVFIRVNSRQVFGGEIINLTSSGFVALGTNRYGFAYFDNLEILSAKRDDLKFKSIWFSIIVISQILCINCTFYIIGRKRS